MLHKNIKRLISLVLAAMLAVTLLPISAFAAEIGDIIRFDELPDGIKNQSVALGTDKGSLFLPAVLNVALFAGGDENSTGGGAASSAGVTLWQSSPEYNGGKAGVYVFTPVLEVGQKLAFGVSLPSITVTVGDGGTGNSGSGGGSADSGGSIDAGGSPAPGVSAALFANMNVNGSSSVAGALGANVTGSAGAWTITMTALPGTRIIVDDASVASGSAISTRINSMTGADAQITGSGNMPADVSGIYLDVTGVTMQSLPMWSAATSVGVFNLVTLPVSLTGEISGDLSIEYDASGVQPTTPGATERFNGSGPVASGRAFKRMDTFNTTSTVPLDYSITSVSYTYGGVPAKSTFTGLNAKTPGIKTSGSYTDFIGPEMPLGYLVFDYMGTGSIKTTYANQGWLMRVYRSNGLKVWVATKQLPDTDLTEFCFFLYNPTNSTISDVALAMDSDVMIASDDRATVEPIIYGTPPEYVGLQMTSGISVDNGKTLALINLNANKYNLGETAPNWWGYYNHRSSYLDNNTETTTPLTSTDSGAVAKARNISVAPGKLQMYSFYIGVGDPSQILRDINNAVESSKGNDCVITSILQPATGASFDNTVGTQPGTVTITVAGDKEEQLVDVTVSDGATWKIYSDPGYSTEITDKTVRNLQKGDNYAYIRVTADDGVTYKDYVVTITRTLSSACDVIDVIVPDLTSIDENASPRPEIRTSVGAEVSDTDVVVTVSPGATWKLYDDEACTQEVSKPVSDYNVTPARDTESEYYIKVTAEDGVTYKIYKLVIARPPSAECEIVTVESPEQINDPAEIADINQSKTIASTVGYNDSSVTVEVTVSPYATWELFADRACNDKLGHAPIPLNVGENSVFIKVTAEDGVTSEVYEYIITRTSSECNIVTVILPEPITDPVEIDNINQNQAFDATVDSSVDSQEIDVTVSEGATWKLYSDSACGAGDEITDKTVRNLQPGDNYAYIKVTAYDGITTKIYTVTLTKISNECEIVTVESPEQINDPAEIADINQSKTIASTVGYNDSSVTVDVTVSTNATWELFADRACNNNLGNAPVPLNVGENSVFIKVTAEDGVTSEVYEYIITRTSSECNIVTVILPEPITDPVEIAEINQNQAFDATVDSSVDSQEIDVTVSEGATWKLYSDSACGAGDEITDKTVRNLQPGDNYAYIKVTAYDGITTKIYTVTLTKKSAECDIILVIDPADAELDRTAQTITATVGGNTETQPIDVTVSPGATWELYSDPACTSVISPSTMTGLQIGQNKAYIKVTAEDTNVWKVYEVTLTRLSNECDIILVIEPDGAVLDRPGKTITADVANTVTSQLIDVTVSPGATWALYSDSACGAGDEITDKTMRNLAKGVNTAYIKVTAQDPTIFKIYTVTITRGLSNACDVLDIEIPRLTLIDESSAPPEIRTSVDIGTDTTDVDEVTVSPGATWKLYTDYECNNEVGKSGGKYSVSPVRNDVSEYYIKVTAEDGVTTKVYKLLIARPPSDECEIVWVNDPVDITVTQDDVDEINNTHKFGMTVGSGVVSQLIDVTVSPYATWKLYSDPACTIEILDKTMLLNVGENKAYIKITAESGVESPPYEITITRESAAVYIPPVATVPPTNIYIDGEPAPRGDVVSGKDTTLVIADHKKLKEQLEAGEENMTVIVQPGTSITGTRLTLNTIEEMAARNMTLFVNAGDISYEMPATAVDTEAVLSNLGTDDSSAVVVEIIINSNPSEDARADVDAAIASRGGEMIIPPLEFTITASYDGKNTGVNYFLEYVRRTIKVTPEQAARITTAIAVEEYGANRHVPTYVYKDNDSWYATISSLTNSTYVLIYNEVNFTDSLGMIYGAVINELGSRVIAQGVGNGRFAGERGVTRAEFAAIVSRALGLPPYKGSAVFIDILDDAWYREAVEAAYVYGLVSGVGDGRFMPEEEITRQEAMIILSRAAALAGYSGNIESLSEFRDSAELSFWAADAARFNVGSGIISGSGGLLRPLGGMSRAEAAESILRLLQKAELIDKRSETGDMLVPLASASDVLSTQPRKKPDPVKVSFGGDERYETYSGDGNGGDGGGFPDRKKPDSEDAENDSYDYVAADLNRPQAIEGTLNTDASLRQAKQLLDELIGLAGQTFL